MGQAAKKYSLEDLADALVEEQRFRDAIAELREYHGARGRAFKRAFGLDALDATDAAEDGVRSTRGAARTLVRATVETLARSLSPFDGFLEASRALVELASPYQPALREAEKSLRDALRRMLLGLLEELVPAERRSLTADALLDAGFDPSTPAPDPSDFL